MFKEEMVKFKGTITKWPVKKQKQIRKIIV